MERDKIKTPMTEEELRIKTWWDGMNGSEKNTITSIQFGEKKSYKKLSYEQIKVLYKA